MKKVYTSPAMAKENIELESVIALSIQEGEAKPDLPSLSKKKNDFDLEDDEELW